MRIFIVGTNMTGGGSGRVKMFRDFLLLRSHTVDVLQFPGYSLTSKMWFYYQRTRARLQGHEERHMKKTADILERKVRKGKYDAVICVETPFSYVLTKDLGCLKVFSCESLQAEELYFSKNFGDLERVRKLSELERDILMKSDYVVFPWKTTEEFARKYVLNGNNFVTINYGCYPQNKLVSYTYPTAIVSLGTLKPYWTNKELLSYLTHVSPYAIHVYGRAKPPRKYDLNYRGFANSLDILYKYQFGLNCVSRNVFRLFTSRILTYLAYGLPALSPDWMKVSHDLKGVLPYNEDNFLDVVEEYSDRSKWEKLSKEAYEQACELDWRKTLLALEKIIAS